ncbi:MAG: DsbA family protein [Actinomycetota bacterium]|nr:DsbA family protein [Actinomycetota bacterium]
MRVDQLVAEGLVEANWLPFELHPEIPREGVPRPARPMGERGHLDEMAAEAGLVMKRRDRMINTRLALSTAEFAREHGKYDEVRDALMKAHWEATADLDRVEDLQRIASGAGLDPEDLKRALEEGRYEPLLDRHREEATAVGINAIPAHVVGRRYLLVGAHPYEAFIQVLDKLRADESAAPGGSTT